MRDLSLQEVLFHNSVRQLVFFLENFRVEHSTLFPRSRDRSRDLNQHDEFHLRIIVLQIFVQSGVELGGAENSK